MTNTQSVAQLQLGAQVVDTANSIDGTIERLPDGAMLVGIEVRARTADLRALGEHLVAGDEVDVSGIEALAKAIKTLLPRMSGQGSSAAVSVNNIGGFCNALLVVCAEYDLASNAKGTA